jgi:hypothetical protein
VVGADEAAARVKRDAASTAPSVLIIDAYDVGHPVVEEIIGMAPNSRSVGLVILCDDNDPIPGYVDRAATATISHFPRPRP